MLCLARSAARAVSLHRCHRPAAKCRPRTFCRHIPATVPSAVVAIVVASLVVATIAVAQSRRSTGPGASILRALQRGGYAGCRRRIYSARVRKHQPEPDCEPVPPKFRSGPCPADSCARSQARLLCQCMMYYVLLASHIFAGYSALQDRGGTRNSSTVTLSPDFCGNLNPLLHGHRCCFAKQRRPARSARACTAAVKSATRRAPVYQA